MAANIHFREDIVDRRGADACLIDKPVGKFLTWRENDERYWLSYMSGISGATHIKLQRHSDGTFQLAESVNMEGKYSSLGELVAHRRYLDLSTASSGVGATASGISRAPNAESGGMRQRGGGDTGGVADLPMRIAPPKAKKVGPDGRVIDGDDEDQEDREWERGVPPTCSRRTFKRLFTGVLATAVALLSTLLVARYRYHDEAREIFTGLGTAMQIAVDDATKVLFSDLRSVAAAGPRASPVLCEQAARRWVDTLATTAASVQIDFETSDVGITYLGWLLSILGIAAGGLVVMMCTHTGRAPIKTSDLNKSAGSRGEPMCNSMQVQWSMSFWALLLVAVAAGLTTSQVTWDLGQASGSVEYAAKTMSMKHPSQQVYPQLAKTDDPDGLDQYGWRRGLWGLASTRLGVDEACMAAMAPIVDGLTHSPPVLRARIGSLLPFLPAAKDVSISGAYSTEGGAGTATGSFFTTASDPLAPTWFAGLLEAATPAGREGQRQPGLWSLIVPSRTGSVHTFVGFIGCMLVVLLTQLMLAEWWLTSAWPKLKSCLRNGGGDGASTPADWSADTTDKDDDDGRPSAELPTSSVRGRGTLGRTHRD